MIDLHFCETPNGHKVSIMLEETGLDYRVIRYNLLEGHHLEAAFRAINPNNRVPALVDHAPIGGGAPYPVFETGAMLIYLAEKTGQFLPADPRRRHQAFQWLMWQVSGLGPQHGQAHHFVRYCPEEIPYAVNRYMKEARRLLTVMDQRLAVADYLAEDYSIADMACWPWIRAAKAIRIEIDDYPNIRRWYDAIGARPGVVAGAKLSPGSMLSAADPAAKMRLTPEQWSILFGERMWDAVNTPPAPGAP